MIGTTNAHKYLVSVMLAAALNFHPSANAAHTNLTIMAVGDSITEGTKGETSYRKKFAELLNNAGCDFDFVGSQTENHTHSSNDYIAAHEGYSGHRADHFLDGTKDSNGNFIPVNGHINYGIDTQMTGPASPPDVFLLHLGSNDANQNQSTSSTVSEIEAVVAKIYSTNTNALVFVANLIPWYIDSDNNGIRDNEWSAINNVTNAINTSYGSTASGKLGSYPNLTLVDMRNVGFDYTDMHCNLPDTDPLVNECLADLSKFEGIHPGPSGEAKIAQAFIDALDLVDGCTPPVASITTPENGQFFNSTTITLAGDATDEGITGFREVRIAIQDNDSGYWFNFDTLQFASPPPVNETDAVLSNSTTNSTDWQISTTLPGDGNYKLLALAVDNSGNENYSGSGPWPLQRQFYVDSTKPAAQANVPSNNGNIPTGVVNIKGSATDNLSGVDRVRVRINQYGVSPVVYWNGSAWSSTPVYLDASVNTNNDTWSLDNVNFSQSGFYRIRLIAHDVAGNISSALSNPKTDFTVSVPDNTPPTADVSSPANASTISTGIVDIQGSATDNLSGVDRVRVRINQYGVSPVVYWNGSAWSSTPVYLDASVNTNNDTWSLDNVNFSQSGFYRIRLIAHDVAGNISSALSNPKTDFTVSVPDNTPPTADVSSPANASTISTGIVDIQGSATDNMSGVDRVRVRINQYGVSPIVYWNGSAWSSTPVYLDASVNTNNDTWSLDNVNFSQSGFYRIRLIAHDVAGNISSALSNPKTDFTVSVPDNTPPTADVSSPPNASTISTGIVDIQGSATDNMSGVDRVRVRINQYGVSPIVYWNGLAWSSTPVYLDASVNTNNDTWSLDNVNFSQSGFYRIRLIAHDVAGNISSALSNPKTDFTVVSSN